MPSDPSSCIPDTDTDQPEYCPEHQKEKIKFFCTVHESLCCVACIDEKHKLCKNDYIPNDFKNFASSEEYKKLVERIQNIESLLAQCQADIHRCKNAVDKMSKTEIEIFQSYKAEIIAYLDKREAELLTEIKRRRDEDDSVLQNLKAQSESIKKDNETTKSKLRGLESHPDRLFISTKRAKDQVAQLQSAVDEIQKKTGYRKYELLKDAAMQAVLRSPTGLATLGDVTGIEIFHF